MKVEEHTVKCSFYRFFFNIKIVPSLEEQKEITTILGKTTEELNQHQQKTRNLAIAEKRIDEATDQKIRTV
jgi:restriction endonuclease S subunit